MREYSGNVLANLVNDNGERKRRRLRVNDPINGKRGAGQVNANSPALDRLRPSWIIATTEKFPLSSPI